MQSYIRPHCWSIVAPGHHGEPRTGGQSLISGLEGQPCYRPCSSAGPTGYAMIQDVLAEHSVDKFVYAAMGTRGPSLKSRSPRQTAQTTRASLLATAIAALLWPRRAATATAHC